jgi:hypothetical protein
VGNFLIEVGEECKKTKLFIDGGELVVGKDSFFEGKDFLPVHSVVKVVPTCVKVRQDLVLDVSKSGSARHLTKQDLIKVEIKLRRIMCSSRSVQQVSTKDKDPSDRVKPLSARKGSLEE